MMKVNLLPAQPSLARRVYNRAKAIAPKLERAALIVLPALFGMPVAMVIESGASRKELLTQIKDRALTAVDHLKDQVALLQAGEQRLALQAEAALCELEDRVSAFGLTIECNEDLAYNLLSSVKYFINSYLEAALDQQHYIEKNHLIISQEILISAQVQLEVVTSLEEMMREAGTAALTDEQISRRHGPLTKEIAGLRLEVAELESRVARMEHVQHDQKIEMEQRFAKVQGTGTNALYGTFNILRLRLSWFRGQRELLKLRGEELMPKRQRLATLEDLLDSLFDLSSEAN